MIFSLAALFLSASLCLVAYAMGLFLPRRNHLPVDGKTVLLTGASEGLGLAVARRFAANGANVIIVSRNVDRLERALAEIKAAARHPERQRFHFISADVSLPDYAGPVVSEAISWNDGQVPDIVWCVAGLATPGLFVSTPLAAMRHNMDVNLFGSAEMAHAILRVWLDADRAVEAEPRHFIFTSSLVAFVSMVGYAPYSPSKWALRALADAISQELLLYPQNVRVHIAYPGTIRSPGLERENQTKPEVTSLLEKSDPVFEPDDIAAELVSKLEDGYYAITTGFQAGALKYGALGASLRHNWFIDTVCAMLTPLIWLFVLPDLLSTIKKYGRTHGHPSTYTSKPQFRTAHPAVAK